MEDAIIDWSENNSTSQWKPGDILNRSNFTSFLIESFDKGAGIPFRQQVFYKWFELKHGVDPVKIIKSFFELGGMKLFSDKEKEELIKSFNDVPAHLRKKETFSKDPNDRLEFQIKSMYHFGSPRIDELAQMINLNEEEFSKLDYSSLVEKLKLIKR